MKRYWREPDGDLYDRKERRFIIVHREKVVGRMYHVNPGPNQVVIPEHEIEERR